MDIGWAHPWWTVWHDECCSEEGGAKGNKCGKPLYEGQRGGLSARDVL